MKRSNIIILSIQFVLVIVFMFFALIQKAEADVQRLAAEANAIEAQKNAEVARKNVLEAQKNAEVAQKNALEAQAQAAIAQQEKARADSLQRELDNILQKRN